jgi:hypothetical protein
MTVLSNSAARTSALAIVALAIVALAFATTLTPRPAEAQGFVCTQTTINGNTITTNDGASSANTAGVACGIGAAASGIASIAVGVDTTAAGEESIVLGVGALTYANPVARRRMR